MEKLNLNKIYHYASIIEALIQNGTEFWNYDEAEFAKRFSNFNKKTLLHLYIESALWNHFNYDIRKNPEEVLEYEEFVLELIALTQIYEIEIPNIEDFIDLDLELELPVDKFHIWWCDNEEVIRNLLQYLANDMFYILFGNRELLLKFNNIASLEFDPKKFPKNSLTARKRVKRKQPPKWVKVAVYSRDKGHCTSCGKDLTHLIVVDSKQQYDHMVPLNLFGPNDPTNIQLLCEACNRDKSGDKISTSNYYMNWWK